MRFLLGILLSFLVCTTTIADDDAVLPQMKLTGTVQSLDGRWRESAIVNDKVWFVGQQYYVKHGKLQFPVSKVSPRKTTPHDPPIVYNPKFEKADIAVLVHVDRDKVYVLYREDIYVIDKNGSSLNKPEHELLEEDDG